MYTSLKNRDIAPGEPRVPSANHRAGGRAHDWSTTEIAADCTSPRPLLSGYLAAIALLTRKTKKPRGNKKQNKKLAKEPTAISTETKQNKKQGGAKCHVSSGVKPTVQRVVR